MSDIQAQTDAWGLGARCVIKERILVTWNEPGRDDTHYFGCLAESHEDSKDCTGRLSLEIHQSEELHRALLVKFHVPIKIPASTSRRAKDMYVVLPTSSLSMSVVAEDKVSNAAHKHLPRINSDEAYINMDLEVDDSHPPYAVMPELIRCAGHLGRRVRGTPRRLLMYLKSLTIARSWSVYLVGDHTLQDQIYDICKSLQRGHAYEPRVKLESIYPDGVRGRVNNWDDYPFSPAENGTSLRYLPSGPPAYNDIYADPRSDCPPSDQSEKSVLTWEVPPAREVSAEVSSRDSSPAPPKVAAKRKRARTDPSSADDVHRNKRPGTAAPSLDSRDPINSSFTAKLELARALSPTQADSARDVSINDAEVAIASSARKPSPVLSEHRSLRSQSSMDPRRAAPGTQLSEHYVDPNHHSLSSDCAAESDEWALYLDMVQFLYYAMSRDAHAYDTYKDHLFIMSSRVKERNVQAFHSIKRACSRDLNKRAARCELLPLPTSEDMEAQIVAIQTWMDEKISRKVYIHADRQFDCMEAVLLRAAKLGPDHVREEFNVRKAECLAAAFSTRKEAEDGRIQCPPVLCMKCLFRISIGR